MFRTEERLNIDAVVYDHIKLYNITQEIKNIKEDLENFYNKNS